MLATAETRETAPLTTRPRAFFMDVDPPQAEVWIDPDVNSSNRRVSPGVVAFYSDTMTRGEWAVTGESIQFAGNVETGRCTLLNGQHRLLAVIDSKTTQRLLIVDGLDPETFAVLDTGKTRSFSDVLSAAGETDTVFLSAGARLAYQVEAKTVTGHGNATRISNLQLQEWLRANSDLVNYLADAHALRRVIAIKNSAALVASWMFHRIDNDAADEFLEGLRTGANLSPGDPRLALRTWMDRNGRNNRTAVHLAITIKAWNSWRQSRAVQLLRWNWDGAYRENFPEPV